jgi:signal transduction histidine kinase
LLGSNELRDFFSAKEARGGERRKLGGLVMDATGFQPSGARMGENGPALDRRLELAESELRQTRKMAALGELVSTTTHEFNNILTTIINYAKLGLRHADDATREKALSKILTAANRAERITNGVLGLARSRSGDRVQTDLGKLVEGSLVLLEREMQKHQVQVELHVEPAPPVIVSAGEIQQVLLNLLTNARQAMPRGGRITIRIVPDPANGTVDLTVRDTGCGIRADQLPRIFDRYYTTKSGPDASGKGGTGVGLATCREIIEAHQGKIRVESTVGVGTAFTLKLPAVRAGEPRGPAATDVKIGIPLENLTTMAM